MCYHKPSSTCVKLSDTFRIPRYIFVNTGGIRFDLVKGPFTFDDSFIVSPFPNPFRFIPSVPYAIAKDLLTNLNKAKLPDKRETNTSRFGSMPLLNAPEECLNPPSNRLDQQDDHIQNSKPRNDIVRRQAVVKPGYVTTE
jgi:2',3'-cyclic-nucleotide 2'-phosphodiesterase (5'-nucleotidase family)